MKQALPRTELRASANEEGAKSQVDGLRTQSSSFTRPRSLIPPQDPPISNNAAAILGTRFQSDNPSLNGRSIIISFARLAPALPFCLAIGLLCLAGGVLRAAEAQVSVDGRTVRVLDLKSIEGAISLRINQEVVIRAEALKSAGFLWSARSDDPAVALREVTIPRPSTGNRTVGAPEPQYFLLRAMNPGKSNIEFRYGRPRDNESRGENVTVPVTVD